jgi:hypothetical protein
MLDLVRALLESSPLLALFIAIVAGYAVGQVSSPVSPSAPAPSSSPAS